MKSSIAAGGIWALSATALLVICFLAFVNIAAVLAQDPANPETVRSTQTAFALYAKVVLFKGLLPAVLLSLALWPLFDHFIGFSHRGNWSLILGFTATAALASAVVVPTLMPLDIEGFPAVKFTGVGNIATTCLEMTLAVAAACLVPRFFLPWLRPNPGD